MESYSSLPKASPQHRLAGYALDLALMLSTCFIGWFIWSLVVWSQGLTPAKQILKMQVVSSLTGKTASWGHMAIRQLLIPLALSLPFTVLALLFEPYLFTADYWADPSYYETSMFGPAGSILMNILGTAVGLLDAFWIFKGGQNRRITDLWAKTDVMNSAASLK
jgi:hypothetical protein